MTPDYDSEREKWDSYYAALSMDAVLNESVAANMVYAEVAQSIAAILPPHSRILEAGCGGGRHSLELSRRGFNDLTLLDFSTKAIDCARSLFGHFGANANFATGDVFAGSKRDPEFDLVFNSGVLEHYSFEEQVGFLKGMASFSRRYVLVLVPNRYCHWYWIYRLQTAANGAWPFGYEKPASSYLELIEAAGLVSLGKAFFAADAVTWAVESIQGMDAALREIVCEAHRRGIIPVEQRSYLVGYLASVVPQDTAAPAPFHPELVKLDSGDLADHRAALAADTLAGVLAGSRIRDFMK